MMYVFRTVVAGAACLLAALGACPSPDPSPSADPNAGDLPFQKILGSAAREHRTTLTLTGVSISSSGPGATPAGYQLYIAHPLSPAAPQIDTPYDLLTTDSLRDGTSLDLRITDVRQFAWGKWQIGTTFDAYGFAGNAGAARYWGSAPPLLDNPVEQQHFVPGMLGPSSIVALRPDAHVQLTAGAIPSTWFSTIVLATIPETNVGYSGAATAPFAPPPIAQTGLDIKLGVNRPTRFELSFLRLPQDAPYHTYALAAHAETKVQNFTFAADAVQEWNARGAAGLEELPTPVDWLGRHFIGPQRESMLAGTAALASGVTKFEIDVAGSRYDPDTTRTLFDTSVSGMARRADVTTTLAGTALDFYGVSTDPTYDPFILNYPLFGDQLNSPWALPGPVFNSFYDLRDMTRYVANQRTLGFSASRSAWGGTASLSFTRAIQAHSTHFADQAQPGFIEPFYSFPFDAADGVLGVNSSALAQLQNVSIGKTKLSTTYANFRYVHPTAETFPADNLGYGQQYLSLQPSVAAGPWDLTATFNFNRISGAWFSAPQNLRIVQPQVSLAGTKRTGAGALTLSASWWNYRDPDRPEAFSSVMLWCRYVLTLR